MLGQYVDNLNWVQNERRYFGLSYFDNFKYYKITITKSSGTGAYVGFGVLEFFEAIKNGFIKGFNGEEWGVLKEIKGALTKNLLVRDEDVQVLHGFDSIENAKAYLTSEMFNNNVAKGLSPLWDEESCIKIYSVSS